VQYEDSTVAAVQEQLAQQGYYRGEIDGIFGAETRRAVVRYQSDQGLRVTGNLNTDTLGALGLQRVASN
jgi:peptidoglycan hydrolase-like protein with peptidoglycan-binding domain